MPSSRSTEISTLHLFAELAAFPFTSECAFRSPLNTLSLQAPSAKSFWRQVESAMLRSHPFSVDEIVNLRDFVWFPPAAGDGGLAQVLRSLPERCLTVDGATVRPRLPEGLVTPSSSGADARDFWRWLLLALPPDLLLAAIPGGPPPCRSVAFVSPRLDRQLVDKGFTQVHLHFGAASDFTDLWVGLLIALAEPPGRHSHFDSPGAAFDEGRDLGGWLERGVLVRFLLAAYLADRDGEERRFEDWVRRSVQPLLSASSAAVLQIALRELAQGCREPGVTLGSAQIRSIYARLSGATIRRPLQSSREIQGLDPIARFFSPLPSRLVPTPEMQFVAASLRHLEQPREQADLFARLFWQVIRLRGTFYRDLIQRPSTSGLLWFFRFYSRIRTARIWSTAVQIESAALLEGIDRGLKHLELRTTPSASISEIRDLLQQTEKAVKVLDGQARRHGRTLEVGLILHFTRDRGGGSKEGVPDNRWKNTYADPGYQCTGWRYSLFYQQKRREARALALLLQRHPETLYRLRGLDVCTDEAGVPTWVLTPLFRHVHEAGRDASAYLQEACPGLYAPTLRSTVHAGEDFGHLLTGLRRVTEALEYLPLREGDRLGHAIALGLDPVAWARRMGTVVMSREERLFDLVWEWGWYAHGRVSPPEGRRSSYLQREIARLSGEIFGRPQPPDRLEMMVRRLHDPQVLCQIGFPTRPGQTCIGGGDEEAEARRLLLLYLTDRGVFGRGRELEWIRTADEADVLSTIQSELMVHVGAQGVVVEVNPSSNLLIGDLRDLERHPLWRLSPPRGDSGVPPLSVCVGSDDPVTFATTLREEYQRLVDAMVMAGHSQEEAERWLDGVREQGRISRFTLPHRENGMPLERPPRNCFTGLSKLP